MAADPKPEPLLSDMTHTTIRLVVAAAALVAATWSIIWVVRYQIDNNHQVQQTCITHDGSWIGGQCIQVKP